MHHIVEHINQNFQSAKHSKTRPDITITEDMHLGQHIFDISSKATKALDFHGRGLVLAPRCTKEDAFSTTVLPKL